MIVWRSDTVITFHTTPTSALEDEHQEHDGHQVEVSPIGIGIDRRDDERQPQRRAAAQRVLERTAGAVPADHRADRPAHGQDGELDRRGVQHLLGEQHERADLHRADGVEHAEDDRQGAQQRVVPQPAHALLEVGRPRRRGRRLGTVVAGRRLLRNWPATRNTRPAATAKNDTASTTNGRKNATASSTLPSGGPTKVLATCSADHIRPLARSRCSVRDDRRDDRLRRVVAQHLGAAEQQAGEHAG